MSKISTAVKLLSKMVKQVFQDFSARIQPFSAGTLLVLKLHIRGYHATRPPNIWDHLFAHIFQFWNVQKHIHKKSKFPNMRTKSWKIPMWPYSHKMASVQIGRIMVSPVFSYV